MDKTARTKSPLRKKSLLRKRFRQARRDLDPNTRAAAEASIHEHLSSHIGRSASVCAYLAQDGEVDLTPWLEDRAVAVGLPCIKAESIQAETDEKKPGEMVFRSWQPGDPLINNRYDIKEPPPTLPMIENADVILTPLVAFDQMGTRLGMGGGYYDRFLSRAGRDSRVIGVAFACQFSREALPRETWDLALHAVITEEVIKEFN